MFRSLVLRVSFAQHPEHERKPRRMAGKNRVQEGNPVAIQVEDTGNSVS